MPRPIRPREIEKSKDFKGSMIRLIKSLKPWKIIMILALLLAMVSAILSLIAPDKLSELTDTITKGIAPNEQKIQEVSDKITQNLMTSNINLKITNNIR